MTKEYIMNKVNLILEDNIFRADAITDLLDEFFSQNVCIPKGANRHPYADEWHQVLEGATFQSYNQTRDNFEDDQWIGYPIRIKPAEPVYEYLWYTNDGNSRWGTLTDYQIWCDLDESIVWYQAKETKRVRL